MDPLSIIPLPSAVRYTPRSSGREPISRDFGFAGYPLEQARRAGKARAFEMGGLSGGPVVGNHYRLWLAGGGIQICCVALDRWWTDSVQSGPAPLVRGDTIHLTILWWDKQ